MVAHKSATLEVQIDRCQEPMGVSYHAPSHPRPPQTHAPPPSSSASVIVALDKS